METTYLIEIILIVLAALLGGVAAKRFNQPLIVGYIVSGIISGAFFSKIFTDIAFLELFSDLGLALLMFSLGLELSLTRVFRSQKSIILASLAQIILVIMLGLFVFPQFLNINYFESLFLASAFSLSSTAISAKMLFDRGELDSILGEVMISWLITQDIAVIPMVMILPSIGGVGGNFFGSLLVSVLKTIALLYFGLWLGKRALPLLFNKLSLLLDSELVLLTSFVIGVGGAIASHLLGLSFAVGAFFAGSALSSTTLNNKIFSEIRPLRYLFTTIFFVALGFLFNFQFFINNIFLILGLTLLVIVSKFMIVSSILIYLKYHSRIAVYSALGMFQVGEFAFVLGRAGVLNNAVDSNIFKLIISVATLSLILTPIIYSRSEKIYLYIRKKVISKFPNYFDQKVAENFGKSDFKKEFKNHAVLVGFGRVGKNIHRGLKLCKLETLVIDMSVESLKSLKHKGLPFIYGDPTDALILQKANLSKAFLIIIAVPDALVSRQIINNARFLNPDIKIIARAHNQDSFELIRSRGVKEVVEPEFEGSLSMARRALGIMDIDNEKADAVIKEIRKEHNF